MNKEYMNVKKKKKVLITLLSLHSIEFMKILFIDFFFEQYTHSYNKLLWISYKWKYVNPHLYDIIPFIPINIISFIPFDIIYTIWYYSYHLILLIPFDIINTIQYY